MNKRHLQLLGVPRVECNEGDVPRFRSLRTIALLGYLVAERRVLAREQLAALFWPDEPADRGKANLRRELHNLAQILPDCWEADRVQVAFVPTNQITIDLDTLQQYAVAGEWQAAAELLRGSFLEGIYLAESPEFESWLLGERERWRQQAEQSFNRAIGQLERQGDYLQAIKYAQRLVHLMPWQEEIHRQLMILLARTGDYNGAIAQFKRCQQTLEAELGVEPMSETFILYERIITIRNGLNFQSLPLNSLELVGRKTELDQLDQLLNDPSKPLVTLVGAGGIGKTRLALTAAARQQMRFLEGVVFVSLVGVEAAREEETVDLLIANLAAALNYRFAAQRPPRDLLLEFLADKELLLLLDNFEQLRVAADLLDDMLQNAPSIKLLVTSRERLGIKTEWVLEVVGLPYPPITFTPSFLNYPAITLFAQSAQRIWPEFELVGDNLTAAVRICQLVEGHPLAIELAASWLRAIPCPQIARQIEQSLDLLATTTPSVNARHRSMRLVLDDSWAILTGDEQLAFCRLAVFRGGFTLAAAEQVAQISLPVLGQLVDKSWLRRGHNSRYHIHELVRQYGNERLAAQPTLLTKTQEQHHQFYATYLEARRAAVEEIPNPAALTELSQEVENLRAAWAWLVTQSDLQKLAFYLNGLWSFYQQMGWYKEAIYLLRQVIDHPQATTLQQLRWHYWLGDAYYQLGEIQPSQTNLTMALTLAGWKIPNNTVGTAIMIVRSLLRQMMHRMGPAIFIGRANEPKAKFDLAAGAAFQLSQLSFLVGKLGTAFLIIFEMLNRAERMEEIDDMATWYAGYALAASLLISMDRLSRWLMDRYAKLCKALLPSVQQPDKKAQAFLLLMLANTGQGNWQQSKWTITQAIEIYQILELPRQLDVAHTLAGELHALLGEFAQSRHYYALECASAKQRNDPFAKLWGFVGQAECSIHLGDMSHTKLKSYLDAALALPQENFDESQKIRLYGCQAQVYLAQDELVLAQQAAETVLSLIEHNPIPTYWALEGYSGVMEVYLRLWENGQHSKRVTMETEAFAKAANAVCQGFWQMTRVYAIARPRANIYQGTIHWLNGKHKKAHQAWQKGINHDKALGMRFDEGLAHYEMARHLPVEDTERQVNLHQAIRIFSELGTGYDLERAQALM
ncbi:MAG: BTAD domain-containing putative transcriptional regulator [Caldilineaceae bacterium]